MRYAELLLEHSLDHVLDSFMTIMSNNSRPEGYWIDANGDLDWVPHSGQHEDAAFRAFGTDDGDEGRPAATMVKQYGHLFGTEWQGDRSYFDYNDVALAHGWVRMIAGGKGRPIFINLMKGRATPKALNVLQQIIRAMQGIADEFVFEFATGADNRSNNITVHGVQQALALVR